MHLSASSPAGAWSRPLVALLLAGGIVAAAAAGSLSGQPQPVAHTNQPLAYDNELVALLQRRVAADRRRDRAYFDRTVSALARAQGLERRTERS